MDKENALETNGFNGMGSLPIGNEESRRYSTSRRSTDKDAGVGACRVCQCTESDRKGNAALGFLGIIPPPHDTDNGNLELKSNGEVVSEDARNDPCSANVSKRSGFIEFISPSGEVFVCNTDVELGCDHSDDTLMELGCSCKSDLALVHYACALKWFVNHGSTVCEICSCVAKNIRTADVKKVVNSLKEYEALRERTSNGEPISAQVQGNRAVDPDAIAAIRRQRLSEISLWFNPHNNTTTMAPRVVSEQPSTSNIIAEEHVPGENRATKWAVEGTGILLATGLLTVTLAWLIAPRVGKKTAKNGLHILLGGVCALTVVIFFRFFVLTRIKYGPARYWAILFVFWFLVFGIWASRTHGAHAT